MRPSRSSARITALKRGTLAEDGDARVVVNRNFPKGEFNHPLVQVRSPGLPDGVQRMGDLRLACVAQMAMAKGEGFKVRAALGAASLFGFNLCDSVTIEDDGRRLLQSAQDKHQAKLGDKGWSDNARISDTLDGHPVQ